MISLVNNLQRQNLLESMNCYKFIFLRNPQCCHLCYILGYAISGKLLVAFFLSARKLPHLAYPYVDCCRL